MGHLWRDLKIAVPRQSPSNLTELEQIFRVAENPQIQICQIFEKTWILYSLVEYSSFTFLLSCPVLFSLPLYSFRSVPLWLPMFLFCILHVFSFLLSLLFLRLSSFCPCALRSLFFPLLVTFSHMLDVSYSVPHYFSVLLLYQPSLLLSFSPPPVSLSVCWVRSSNTRLCYITMWSK